MCSRYLAAILFCNKNNWLHLQKPLTGQSGTELGEDDAFLLMRGGHEVMMNVLVSRHRSLQVVKAMWSAGNVRVGVSYNALFPTGFMCCASQYKSVGQVRRMKLLRW